LQASSPTKTNTSFFIVSFRFCDAWDATNEHTLSGKVPTSRANLQIL
jgi:hypothetical protein